jgi:epoxide hydrolase
MTGTAIRPYRVEIAQVALDDLADRLRRALWPDELPGVGDSYGVPEDRVRSLARYWLEEFDWRALEARLNAHPQFVTTIDGEDIHFLHVRSSRPDATPLVLTHGWPGTVVEYLDVIAPLTEPESPTDPAFHLVIPSLPGFGFSGPTRSTGWNRFRTARAWAELMARLGYERYGAVGNDAGSMISPELGRIDGEHVVGVHVTQLFSFPSGDPAEFVDLSEEDAAAMRFLEEFTGRGGLAYNAYQSAQPQTLAYALQDSPAGWLAWVTQLFQRTVDRDYIITSAATYWLTGTVGSSIRYYHAEARAQKPTEPTTAPTGVAIFAEDFQSVRRFSDRDHANIVHWRHYDRGSHFSPRDAPDELVGDIREFFRALR